MTNNDEERIIVEVPAHEPESETGLSTRRILTWALVFVVGVFLLSVLLGRPSYDSKTVPEALVGEYTCDLPEYSDRYLTLKPSSITFGTGGTSFVRYRILGIERADIEGFEILTLHFRDVGGTKYERKMAADPSGSYLYFTSQPEVVWKRFGS
jgi:hypothetical protein